MWPPCITPEHIKRGGDKALCNYSSNSAAPISRQTPRSHVLAADFGQTWPTVCKLSTKLWTQLVQFLPNMAKFFPDFIEIGSCRLNIIASLPWEYVVSNLEYIRGVCLGAGAAEGTCLSSVWVFPRCLRGPLASYCPPTSLGHHRNAALYFDRSNRRPGTRPEGAADAPPSVVARVCFFLVCVCERESQRVRESGSDSERVRARE